MDFIEISAKTVDDAVTEGLIKLGTTSDKIEYEVMEKGSAGFFGLGSKPAKNSTSARSLQWKTMCVSF